MVNKQKSDNTRRRLLEAAFQVICRRGFQAAGLNEILELAGLTKGAIYHHFSGKTALGYAVVEEIVGELVARRWISPLSAGGDSLTMIPRVMRGVVVDMDQREIALGCPLGNLAAEMSAIDDGFARRIDAIYQGWRDALTAALSADGGVGDDDPERIATFLVASMAGFLALAKVGARRELLLDGITELEFYLHQLRTDGAEPPAARSRASAPALQPPKPEPEPKSEPESKPERDPEPEPRYAPPPAEMEDYLL